jgi:CRP/FNR family transcriptional regulator, cyclic AMP receptor protein
MNRIDGTFGQRVKAVLDLTDDRLDHMVIAAGLDAAADLRYGNWRGFDLSGADLRGFNFTGADLTGARFDNAFIAGAIFDHTIYDPTSLRNATDYEEFLRHTTGAGLAAKGVSSAIKVTRFSSSGNSIGNQHFRPSSQNALEAGRTAPSILGNVAIMPSPKDTPHFRGVDKRALLKNHYLFSNLSSDHIDRLAACSVGKSVPRGTSICAKGDPGSSLFVICQGKVKISAPSADGHDALLNLIGQGDVFGEVALLDGRPRSADVVAITDCELFAIERRDFLPLVKEEPEIALKMIEILCAKLRRTTEQAENLMFLHLPGRLAKALLRLSDGDEHSCERKVAVTQKDLGNIIGMSRESTNRQLRIWEEQGWVRLERGGIVILSAKALDRIAESDTEG